MNIAINHKSFYTKIKSCFPIYRLLILFFICIAISKIHLFANPIHENIYNLYFYIPIIAVSVLYYFSKKMGRIAVLIGGLLLLRAPSLISQGIDIIIIGGYFSGGVLGILIINIIEFKKTDIIVNPEDKNIGTYYLPILVFISILLINSFIQFFHFPFLLGVDVQDIYFYPDIPSRSLFSLPVNILIPMIYYLLYFYAEESSSQNEEQTLQNDIKDGIFLVFIIQTIIIFLQTFISNDIFSRGANDHSASLGRVTGLFRDAGSATWIYPIVSVLSLVHLKEIYLKNSKFKKILLGIFLMIVFVLGYRQGRAYNLVLFSSIFIALYPIIKNHNINNKILIYKSFIFIIIFLGLFITVAKFTNEGKLWNVLVELSSDKNFSQNFINIDPPRYFLNQFAVQIFSENPIFGGGISSVPVNLINPAYLHLNPDKIVDGPGSFYTGILSDIGILGTIILILWVVQQINIRIISLTILHLAVPFMVGYQISNPDGSLIILLLLTIYSPILKNPSKDNILFTSLISCIAFLFIIRTYILITSQFPMPMYRFQVNNYYQLSAYSKNKALNLDGKFSDNPILYHSFRGKVIWKSGSSGEKFSCFFLGEETKLSSINLKISYKDIYYNIISYEIISINKKINSKISIPQKTSYILIQEEQESFFLPLKKTIFNVASNCFSEKYEYIGRESSFDY